MVLKICILIYYKAFWNKHFILLKWIDGIKKKRVLVLTATPIRQEVDEIAPVLNIVLPPSKRFELGSQFKSKYFRINETKDRNVELLEWKKGMQDEFQERIKGYVSVVKQTRDVKVEYIGHIIPPIKYYRLFAHTMSPFQSTHYLEALDRDEKDREKKK